MPGYLFKHLTGERSLGALAFLLMVAYWPGVPNAPLVLRWAVPMVLLPLILWTVFRRDRLPVSDGTLLGGAFVAWAALSLLWTTEAADGAWAILAIELVALPAFLIGSVVSDLKPVYIGLTAGLLVSLGFVIVQHNGHHPVFEVTGPAGLFGNKNALGEIAALVLVGCAASRLWWCLPVPALVLLFTAERTAWVAVAVAALGWLWFERQRFLAGVLAAMMLAAGVFAWVSAPPESTLTERGMIWGDTLDGILSPQGLLVGHGIGAFFTAWPEHATRFAELGAVRAARAPDEDIALAHQPKRPDHAHNDFLEAVFELGLPGGLLLAALFAVAISEGGPEALVVLALAAECCFAFPLHYPATLLLGALAAGRAARSGSRLRDLLDRLGSAFVARLESSDARDASGGIR